MIGQLRKALSEKQVWLQDYGGPWYHGDNVDIALEVIYMLLEQRNNWIENAVEMGDPQEMIDQENEQIIGALKAKGIDV